MRVSRRFGMAVTVAALCWACKSPSEAPPPNAPPPPGGDGTPQVVVDAATRFQTIHGWEAVSQAGHDESEAFPAYRNQLFDRAVDELGLDRLRVEVRSGSEQAEDFYAAKLAGRLNEEQWRQVRYATVNDNGDPFVLNERGFWFTELDNQIEKVVLPLRERLEARGRRLIISICYVAFTNQLPGSARYDHADPEEYAEFVQATLQHLSSRYGIVPDAWEMSLEPDNTREWTPAYMRRAVVAVSNRLARMNLQIPLIAPSTTSMSRSLDYADALVDGGRPDLWRTLSYHRYEGVSDAVLRSIGARQQQLGIETAMLEHLSSGYAELHQDLKVGNVSSWQQFTIAYPGESGDGVYFAVDAGNASAPSVRLTAKSTYLAQYFRYVRQGAVRVGATSSDAAFDPVAFVNADGKPAVVVIASRAGAFDVRGLTDGPYEVTYTTSGTANARAGSGTVTAGGALRVQMPAAGVVTIAGS